MSDSPGPLARIRLARSLPRMLVMPLTVVAAGAAGILAGLTTAAPPMSFVLVLLGALIVLGGGAAAVVLLSIRLAIAPSAVVVSWLGGERRYPLVPGPVTRVRLAGPSASRLRPRSGGFGWGIGRARLRDEEDIDLVRLAPTATAILVPTEGVRLAIAPADEAELLSALTEAAQLRHRDRAAEEAEPDEPEVDFEPASLTGIERALLEERLARERLEAQRAAEAARAAAAALADGAAAALGAGVAEITPRPPRAGRLPAVVGWIFVLLPTAAAGAAWWVAQAAGHLPPSGTDLARLSLLALVLAGPATSIGAIMALAWWPRLVGVVVAGGLVATVLISRSFVA